MPILTEIFDPTIYASLAFLFGIAAQFRAMDGYSLLRRVMSSLERRVGIVYATVIITSIFSPLILNDVVVLILTPVLVSYSKNHNSDITMLLVAEITFTNISSSLTPLGNPQNILLWETTGISFHSFVLGTSLRLVFSAAIAVALLVPFSRRMKNNKKNKNQIDRDSWEIVGSTHSLSSPLSGAYLIAVAIILLIADLFGLPPYQALGLGFLLGFAFSFRSIGKLGREFDLRSLLILFLLVGITAAVATIIQPQLSQFVIPAAEGIQPYSGLFVAALSNVISNVPATQLILKVAAVSTGVAPKIAVEAGLAGNIDPIASFANILALLMARRSGYSIRKAVLLQLVVGTVSFLPALI